MEVNWVKGHIFDLKKKLVEDYGFTDEKALEYIKNYEQAPMDEVIRTIMKQDDGLSDQDIDDYFEVVRQLEGVEGLESEIMGLVQSHEKKLVEIILSTTTIMVVDIKKYIGKVNRICMDVKDLKPSSTKIRAHYSMKEVAGTLHIVVDKELYGCAIERYGIMKRSL